MKTAMIITMKDCWEYTQACLNSISTALVEAIIVIDDGSTQATKNALAEYRDTFAKRVEGKLQFEVIVDPDTPSLSAKWNQAIEMAKGDGYEAVLICNNDILFAPHTIDTLVRRLEKAQQDEPELVVVTAHNLRDEMKPEDVEALQPLSPDAISEAPHPDFSCLLVLISAWEKVGKFDEGYIPCYFEDNDFHTMLKLYDLKAISTTAAGYYHFGSVTQNSVPGGICKGPQFDKNRRYFIKKFGAPPSVVNLERARKRLGLVND